jgi:toxin ParE1/3/4
MKQPRITAQAQVDLDQAWDFLAQRNLRAADRLLDRILERARLHAQFPLMGRPRDDLVPGLRSFSISPYVVFYRPAKKTIEVLRVLHGSRDVDAIMKSHSD